MTTTNIIRENGKAFRILQIGETIERGDQYRDSKTGAWSDLDGSHIGERITKDHAYPTGYYRRPCVLPEESK